MKNIVLMVVMSIAAFAQKPQPKVQQPAPKPQVVGRFRAAVPKTATAHSVTLNWTQSTSIGITGNNVYRCGPAPCTNFSNIAVLAATTTFTDTVVTGGVTYDYVVTALAGTGNESANSNTAALGPIPNTPNAPTALCTGPNVCTVQ